MLVEQLWDVLINEITCSLSKDKRDAVQRRQARRMPTLHQKYRVRRGKCLHMEGAGQSEGARWMHGRRARLPLVTDESRLGRRTSG